MLPSLPIHPDPVNSNAKDDIELVQIRDGALLWVDALTSELSGDHDLVPLCCTRQALNNDIADPLQTRFTLGARIIQPSRGTIAIIFIVTYDFVTALDMRFIAI